MPTSISLSETPPPNPLPSHRVVVQQPVENVQAAGVQPEAGSSPSIVREPVDSRGNTCPVSWRRTVDSGKKIQLGGTSAPSPSHPHHPGSQVVPAIAKWYSLMITMFLKDGVVPKGQYQLAAGLGRTQFPHLPGPTRRMDKVKVQSLRVLSLSAMQALASCVFPFQMVKPNASTQVIGTPSPTCLPSAPHPPALRLPPGPSSPSRCWSLFTSAGTRSSVGMQVGVPGGLQVLCSHSHQWRSCGISTCARGPAMDAGSISGLPRPPCAPRNPTAARPNLSQPRSPRCPLACSKCATWTEEAVVEISSWHSPRRLISTVPLQIRALLVLECSRSSWSQCCAG
ncbi:uncharacterized protein [Muntiacus reevesi]|uniref:uncharacterized protein n=1 Tax=Muntiacus reevesi TaxID=9886 RepID=UPI003306F868